MVRYLIVIFAIVSVIMIVDMVSDCYFLQLLTMKELDTAIADS